MTNKEIASVLKETASLIELTGGNPFRSRAMANAGRTIERLEEPVQTLLSGGTLTKIQGIGAGLAEQIDQLLTTGSFEARDDLLSSLPPGLLDMLAVKGLGAKKVRTLWKSMGIQTLDELESAAEAGRIAQQEGFGEKSERSILENVKALRQYRKQRHFADAFLQAESLVSEIARIPGISGVEITGALRRNLETVSEIELLVEVRQPENLDAFHLRFGPLEPVTNPAARRVRTTMPDGFPLILWITEPGSFGTNMFERTGSDEFVRSWKARFGELPPVDTELAVFAASNQAEIPPELRETEADMDQAAAYPIPILVRNADLKGSLHNHSTYSDGANTLEEMATAARGMGLSYFGICDHSQSLRIAGGLAPKDVLRQQQEIEALNAKFSQDGGSEFRIYSGIESDILADGSLDYTDDVLSTFDFIVASVHIGFNMTEAEATERVIRAVSNPYTRILGHPTGRLLLRRKGYPLDHEAVLDACAEHGVAVELNANPYRLDLDWRWIRRATDRGIMISINPDAHSIDQLAYTRWGVAVARKGWLSEKECLNALSLKAFDAWIGCGRPEGAPPN